ncbi:MAG: PAS domain S-box protein [Gracilimonas sp.]|uniref:PAS domain S-box protein n=1 Tax=Gracilimonas sp. TaxID=1974203 RepID=UPI0019A2DE64|nr:PAS domain S-box protein [Gracilimonas sp.]MBD3615829.1 PAS domain S-box protein [Gracilimonas sp.]
MVDRQKIIQIFKATPTPTSIVLPDDPKFTFVQVNEAYTKMTQTKTEELIGNSLFESFPENPEEIKPTGVERLRNSFRKVIAEKKQDKMDAIRYDIKLDDGQYNEIYWEVINTPILNEDGNIEFIINSATNITEQVLSERANRLMLNNSEDSFILIDENLIVQNFNDHFAQNYKDIFGIEVKKGDSVLEYAQPERQETVKKIYKRVLKGETVAGEIPAKAKDGTERYFTIKYKPAEDEQGNIIGSFISLLEKTEEHKAKLELEQNEAKFRALVEHGNDIVFILDPDGNPFYASPSIKNVLGYTQQEALEFNMLDNVHPNDIEMMRAEIKKCLDNPSVPLSSPPARIKVKQGSWHLFEGTITNMLNDPAINGIVYNFRETTDLRKVELEREFERRNKEALINNTNDLLWSVDRDLNLITANESLVQAINEQIGIDIKPGDPVFKGLVQETGYRKTWEEYYRRALTGESFRVETFEPRNDKEWYETSFNPIFDKDEITGVACFSRNITQAKQAEKSLKQAEEKYRNVVEHSTNMFYQHDTEGNLTYVSQQSTEFLGYTPEEAIRDWTDYVTDHPVNEKGEAVTLKAIETGESQPPYELQLRKANGDIIWVEVHETPLKNDGKVVGIAGSLTDITERKEFEEELQKSLERYNYVSKATRDAIYDWDIKKDNLHWGEGFRTLFGHQPGEEKFPLKEWEKLVHPDDLEETYRDLNFTLKDSSTNHWEFEYRLQKSDGSYAYVLENGFIIRDADGKATRMIGAIRDISENKKDEIQTRLQQNVAKYFKSDENLKPILSKVLEHLALFGKFNTAEIWIKSKKDSHLYLISNYSSDKKGQKFYKQSKHIKQFRLGEGLPGTAWENKTIESWDIEKANELFIRNEAAFKAGIKSAFGLPLLHSDEVIGVLVLGSEQNLEANKSKIYLYEALQTFLGSEIKRKQQEEEMRLLFESATEILAITSPNGRFIKVNPAFSQLTGYSEEELTSQNFENFLHPDDINKTKMEYEETITGERQANHFVNRYKTKSGEYRWISWSSSEVIDEDGSVFAYGRDITKTKELEHLLNEVQRMARIGAWEVDLKNEKIYWSTITKEIHEVEPDYNPDLETGINFYKNDGSQEIVRRVLDEAREHGKSWDEELQILTKKGNDRWVRVKGEPEIVEGACMRIYGSIQDVHDRKQAEIALEEAFEEKETILESIGDAFFALDHDWVVTYWNKEAENVLYKTKGEMIGEVLWDKYEDAIDLEFYRQYHKAIEEQVTVHFEEYYPAAEKWFEVSAYPSQNGLSVYFKDISERKKANLELEAAYKEKENILESIDDGFFTLDKNWTVTYWNQAAERMLQTPKQKILDQNLWDIFEDAVDLPSYTNYHRAMHQKINVDFEDYYPTLDKWFDISAYPSSEGISVFFKEITARKKNEEEIRRINERFAKVTEATNDAIWDFNIKTGDLFWGKGFETLFGYDLEEIKPSFDFLTSLIHPEDRNRVVQNIETYMQDSSKKNWFEEYRFKKNDGTYAYVIDRAIFMKNNQGEVIRVVGAMTDLTKQKEYENSLQKLNREFEAHTKELAETNAELEKFLQEKETLLAEIHHRVKNNLAVVSGMMQLQAFGSDNEELQAQLLDSVARIKTMASVHELLYQSNSFSQLEFSETLKKLVENVSDTYLTDKEIVVDIQCDPVTLNINLAIPAALIVNEVLTNAYKHAFKASKDGKIIFKLKEKDSQIYIEIADNGVGMPQNKMEKVESSLGMHLIAVLSDQLEGVQEYKSKGKGTTFTLNFPKKEKKGGIGNTSMS